MTNVRTRAGQLAAAVEAELRRLLCWSETTPAFDPATDGPFGMRRLAFEQWLQAVLVPALREIERGERPVPPSSNLCGHAVREFDGRDDRQPLIDLLYQVDALSGGGGPPILQPRLASAAAWLVLAVALLWAIPGVALARSVGDACLGAPAETVVLTGALARDGGPWHGLHVSAVGVWVGDRARFERAQLDLGVRPGRPGPPVLRDVALVDRAEVEAAVVAMAAVPAQAAPLVEFLAALHAGVDRPDAEGKLAAVGPVEVLSLDRHPGAGGDGAWFLGFVLVYLPGAAAAIAIAVRQRRRLA